MFLWQHLVTSVELCCLGNATSVRVMTDESGGGRGFGFVSFENHEDAQKVRLGLFFGDICGHVGDWFCPPTVSGC